MREQVGSRGSARQVSSTSLASNAAIGQVQRCRASAPSRLAPLRSDSPSSCFRPMQTEEAGQVHVARSALLCGALRSALCTSSPKDMSQSLPLAEDSPTAGTPHLSVNGESNPMENFMQCLQEQVQDADTGPMDQTDEELQNQVVDPLARQERTAGKTKAGQAGHKARSATLKASRDPMKPANLTASGAAQAIEKKQKAGLSALEVVKMQLNLELRALREKGIDYRPMLEEELQAENNRRSNIGSAGAAASAPHPVTPSRSAAGAVYELSVGPLAWPATEVQVAYRSSWIPPEFGTAQDRLLHPGPSTGPGPAAISATPATCTPESNHMHYAVINAGQTETPGTSYSHDLQQQQTQFREINHQGLFSRMPCCPSRAAHWQHHSEAAAAQRVVTGYRAAAEGSSTSDLSAAAATVGCMPAGGSVTTPMSLVSQQGPGSHVALGNHTLDEEVGNLMRSTTMDLLESCWILDQDPENISRDDAAAPFWSPPQGLQQADASSNTTHDLPPRCTGTGMDLGMSWQLRGAATQAAVNDSTVQQASTQALALSAGWPGMTAPPIGEGSSSSELMHMTPSPCIHSIPGSAQESAVPGALYKQNTAVGSPFIGNRRQKQVDGDESDGPEASSDADPGMMEGMPVLTNANGDKRIISKDMLVRVYHLPISDAAEKLGMGVTVLKKYCRQFKVGRWPFRKLTSIDKLMEIITQEKDSPDKSATAVCLLRELELCREEIYRDPMHEIPENIKRLRQANFKNVYRQNVYRHRHASRHPKAEGEREADWGEDGELKDE